MLISVSFSGNTFIRKNDTFGRAGRSGNIEKIFDSSNKKESAKSYTLKNRNGFRVSWILRKNLFKNAGEDLVYIFSIIIKIETLSDLLFA